jgi:cGMP-dependent protein kinase
MQVPILFPLSDRQLWQLARVLTPRNFAKGETVFRQGDVADKFYICQKGAFSCFTSELCYVTYRLRLLYLL